MKMTFEELCEGIWPAHTTGLDPSRGLFSMPILRTFPEELGGSRKHVEIKYGFVDMHGIVRMNFPMRYKPLDFNSDRIRADEAVAWIITFIGHPIRHHSGRTGWLTQFGDTGSQKAFYTALSAARHA